MLVLLFSCPTSCFIFRAVLCLVCFHRLVYCDLVQLCPQLFPLPRLLFCVYIDALSPCLSSVSVLLAPVLVQPFVSVVYFFDVPLFGLLQPANKQFI